MLSGSGGCGDEGGGHVVYGAEGYGVELAVGGERFGAGGPDFYVGEVEGADHFSEEGGFLVLRFRESYGDFWV